jgi:hypothetical protein
MKLKIGILLACLGLMIGFTGLYYYTTPLSVNKARESNKPFGFITKGKLYVQKARVNRNYIYGLELKLATWNVSTPPTPYFLAEPASLPLAQKAGHDK